MTAASRTGMREGFVSCEACGLLSRPAGAGEPGECPRCGGELEFRRRDAIQRTWAFVIAAAICYLPANILPVMLTTTLTSEQLVPGADPADRERDDPAGEAGGPRVSPGHGAARLGPEQPGAVAKLAALAYLLVTVQRGSFRSNRERARLYRVLEIIGRWSMVDVFVATFVVALIQLQPLMSVTPESGVLFFSAVVILTIIASESFDPRLIWDSSQGKQETDD
ncbi:MAG: Paraquat-inducible protein [Deltaproteobacteria bacterium]|nr:Paraquat-inducible protein [Deltaproteobacteria bacterium]